ncbi:MAG: multifunctional oxoglutarate decarboxylase/oxoglutarate dehydrogenase thiamine pyrophosphate-binding subunit/dihydrolipoyllysine-residue succinyltransferase subunit [Candidatus Kapabacteria bacterium]|nr:multifunctional oxoglutarate decarboxylase/oxoglutarate dehydrogenase thiamine pyrophosphate-binding subunit/dihydrolipoyllysine-residue succinyltransferase subunit [Candidatus Kapabacteria bacterium]
MIDPNIAFIDELFFNYLKDPDSVSEEWREFFKKGYTPKSTNIDFLRVKEEKSENNFNEITTPKEMNGSYQPLNSIQAKIAENMEQSLYVPTATSVRTIPVKALDENRRIINKYLTKLKRPKVSFTHILGWAIVKALIKFPQLNDTITEKDGKYYRVKRKSINIGFATDITRNDGTRLLLVPNIKNAQDLNFSEFITAFDKLIENTRNNKLNVDDLVDTTVSLTNPGMIGTTASNPRLMKGQGLIIATGAIDYPVEFQAVRPEILTNLAISKVITITSTYDHRIIQGAESAEFLAYINKLLLGEEQFYDQIFAILKIPFEPVRWTTDAMPVNQFGRFDEKEAIEKSAHVVLMINSYRVRGHLLASVNPLGFSSYYYPELDPSHYGFTIWDLDRVFHADDNWDKNNLPLRDIIEIMRETYCGSFGIEFMHIQDPDKKNWIKSTLEKTRGVWKFTSEEKVEMFKKLVDAEEFENFLHTKFVGHKRFSLEGSESVMIIIDRIFNKAAEKGLYAVTLGMAHRGRLNTLVNLIGKPLQKVFNEFEGEIDPDSYHGSGDVKYHLGSKGIYQSKNGKSVKVIIAPNPSHLELVDPVIEGMARAYDDQIGDKNYTKTLPVLIHGDAAFAGQGIVAETLNLSQLEGYKTGGTIHVIINNQIGFTTSIQDARSTIYATDIAKMIQVPIIHVNGNDPEACAGVAQFAFEYRNKFNSDIIIDMLCYRKYGHNEGDEPTYTQPLLYKKIKQMEPVTKIYFEELQKEGILTEEDSTKYLRQIQEKFYNAYSSRKELISGKKSSFQFTEHNLFEEIDTSYDLAKLKEITNALTFFPENFQPNPKIVNLLKKRKEMVDSDKAMIDYSMAEALAFGSILLDGFGIRFSGQDSRRGTFSQRHAVLTDVRTEETYVPLNNIRKNQELLRIYDSPLSELAVLGFEYGYSVASNNILVLWEAQFGDFANMAQPIIDQFIVCAESKWGQTSNIVLLLPHGYDGQGPEHSSARLERFLQLSSMNNIIVANLTQPSQYFHILRRQVLMVHKKPLIIMTPKGALRHPLAVSSLAEFYSGKFNPILDDNRTKKPENIRKVLICSGKIYFELMSEIIKKGIEDIAVIRVEQIYPFHKDLMAEILKKYKKAKDICWVQEEPENMGAYYFIKDKIFEVLPQKIKLNYIGRPSSPATATGSPKVHQQEQDKIIVEALS